MPAVTYTKTAKKNAPKVAKAPPAPVEHIGPFNHRFVKTDAEGKDVSFSPFSLVCFHRKTGTWKYLMDFLLNMTWEDATSDVAVSGTASLDNNTADDGTKISDFLEKGALAALMFTKDGDSWDELARFNVWGVRQKDSASQGPTVDITLYDQMAHLKASYDTFLYATSTQKKKVAWTAYTITKDVCNRFGIPFKHIPKYKSMHKFTYIYAENSSIYDFLLKVWTIERKHSSRRFLLRYDKGQFSVTVKKAQSLRWELIGAQSAAGNFGGMTDIEYNSYLDPGDATSGTATSVTVRGVKKDAAGEELRTAQVIVKATNKKLVDKFGLLHKVYQIEELTDRAKALKKAKALLASQRRPKVEGTVNALGIPWLRAGDPVFVKDLGVGINGSLFASSVRKSIDGNGAFTMSVGLAWMDIVPSLNTSGEDLSPTASADPGAPVDGKPAAMPSWLYPIIVQALKLQNLPEGWASSNSLCELLQHESNFNPKASNGQGSGAYGLFQFMPTTWASYTYTGTGANTGPHIGHKTDDPLIQCQLGLQYISKNHGGTPESNWEFWQARVPINGKDVGNWY